MTWVLRWGTALWLLLAACGSTEPEQVFVPAQPVADACLRAWDEILGAWEAERELSTSCARLDASVEVYVLEPAELPCPGAAACSFEGRIYLGAALSPRQVPGAAVHEWAHLLSLCEEGDGDADHTDTGLWAARDKHGSRGHTIEAVATRAAPPGPCLGNGNLPGGDR